MGWLGTIFTLLGTWNLAAKKRSSLVLLMFGNLCWAYEGFLIQKLSLIVINVVLLLMTVRTLYRWGRA